MAMTMTFSFPNSKLHVYMAMEKYIENMWLRGERVSKSGICVQAVEEFLKREKFLEDPKPVAPELTDEQREIQEYTRNWQPTGPPEPAPVRAQDTDVYEYTPEAQAQIDAWADSVVKEQEPEGSEEGTTP